MFSLRLSACISLVSAFFTGPVFSAASIDAEAQTGSPVDSVYEPGVTISATVDFILDNNGVNEREMYYGVRILDSNNAVKAGTITIINVPASTELYPTVITAYQVPQTGYDDTAYVYNAECGRKNGNIQVEEDYSGGVWYFNY